MQYDDVSKIAFTYRGSKGVAKSRLSQSDIIEISYQERLKKYLRAYLESNI